jgi:hypothetical protein
MLPLQITEDTFTFEIIYHDYILELIFSFNHGEDPVNICYE